jgi:hypothetical protein
MIVKVEDKICWICGRKNQLTLHHSLPQYLKPRHNLLIPICSICHHKLNEDDKGSIKPLLLKTFLTLESVKDLFEALENKIKLGETLEKDEKNKTS